MGFREKKKSAKEVQNSITRTGSIQKSLKFLTGRYEKANQHIYTHRQPSSYLPLPIAMGREFLYDTLEPKDGLLRTKMKM